MHSLDAWPRECIAYLTQTGRSYLDDQPLTPLPLLRSLEMYRPISGSSDPVNPIDIIALQELFLSTPLRWNQITSIEGEYLMFTRGDTENPERIVQEFPMS